MLDLGGVAEHGGGDGAAEVGVEALVLALGGQHREPGQGISGTAAHHVVGDDGVEHRLTGATVGGSGGGRRPGCRGRGARIAVGRRRVGGVVVVAGTGRQRQYQGEQHGGPSQSGMSHRGLLWEGRAATGTAVTPNLAPAVAPFQQAAPGRVHREGTSTLGSAAASHGRATTCHDSSSADSGTATWLWNLTRL